MAELIINTSTDADAVWLWELCKKLGYGVETVRFGHIPPIDGNRVNVSIEEAKNGFSAIKREAVCHTRDCGKNHHRRKESARIIEKITKL